MTRDQQTQLLRAALQALLDAVKAGGTMGAPAGVMYAALLDKLTLSQFNQLMGALLSAGKVRKQGDLYFWVADL